MSETYNQIKAFGAQILTKTTMAKGLMAQGKVNEAEELLIEAYNIAESTLTISKQLPVAVLIVTANQALVQYYNATHNVAKAFETAWHTVELTVPTIMRSCLDNPTEQGFQMLAGDFIVPLQTFNDMLNVIRPTPADADIDNCRLTLSILVTLYHHSVEAAKNFAPSSPNTQLLMKNYEAIGSSLSGFINPNIDIFDNDTLEMAFDNVNKNYAIIRKRF